MGKNYLLLYEQETPDSENLFHIGDRQLSGLSLFKIVLTQQNDLNAFLLLFLFFFGAVVDEQPDRGK